MYIYIYLSFYKIFYNKQEYHAVSLRATVFWLLRDNKLIIVMKQSGYYM